MNFENTPERQSRVAAAELVRRAGKLAAAIILLCGFVLARPQGMNDSAWWLGVTTLIMAALWLTQAIPLAATSLLPLVAFPLLRVQPAQEVSASYINHHIFLYMGGFIIALGIERWNLHRRIALHIVRVIGTSPRRLVLGFMLATALLSMWISNTASSLLMLPIGLAMLTSLGELSNGDDETTTRLGTSLMLAIAYAASIGGMMTLVGTPTNVSFVGIWDAEFRAAGADPVGPEMSLATWMLACVPVGVVLLAVTWAVLTAGFGGTGSQADPGLIEQRLKALGPPDRAEKMVGAVFLITAALWILRGPLGLPKGIHDSTIAVGMSLVMFFLPVRRDGEGRTEYLMDWDTAKRQPWDVLLLIGGGFALANAFRSTGLSGWLGEWLAAQLTDFSPIVIVAAVCLLMTFLTEFTTNVATLNAVLPVLAATTVALNVDPRLVMIPATLCTSCAFMLPIATPPNAIVFGSGRIPLSSMVRYGFVLNLLSVAIITLATFTLFVSVFGINMDGLPDWAQ